MRRRPRGLTPAERALWEAHARRYTPRADAPASPPATSEPGPELRPKPTAEPRHDPATPPPPPAPRRPFRVGERAATQAPPHDLAPPVAEALARAPLAMDRRTHRAMLRGRAAPEARLDLHGRTLAQAHPALIRFVERAHADGRRLLLVITGKGGPDTSGEVIPRPRGLLRRQVPAWLAQPPLAGLVQQITPAHRRHGGEGAYYVYLRRRG